MIAVISVITVAASFVLTRPLVSVFARPDGPVYDLAVMGNKICTAALLFIGFNIFAGGGTDGACFVRLHVPEIWILEHV